MFCFNKRFRCWLFYGYRVWIKKRSYAPRISCTIGHCLISWKRSRFSRKSSRVQLISTRVFSTRKSGNGTGTGIRQCIPAQLVTALPQEKVFFHSRGFSTVNHVELLQGPSVFTRLQRGPAAERRQLHGRALRHGERQRADRG